MLPIPYRPSSTNYVSKWSTVWSNTWSKAGFFDFFRTQLQTEEHLEVRRRNSPNVLLLMTEVQPWTSRIQIGDHDRGLLRKTNTGSYETYMGNRGTVSCTQKRVLK
jgi:hypothetical protein